MKLLLSAAVVLVLAGPLARAQQTPAATPHPSAQGQKTSTPARASWRSATDAELAALLPARAPVEKEHIETEMRTASGIVDRHNHYIAGVVLITAGYSAEGKYSHFLVVQAPVKIGGISFKPGEYVFGYTHDGDVLKVHFNVASSGALVGSAEARRLPGTPRVEILRIWPPSDKSLFQIGRFALPYEIEEP